jgi:hypothetical protein
MSDGLQNVPQISLYVPAGHMEHLQRTGALLMSLGFGSTAQGHVSLLLSFYLHYFSAPSEQFQPKQLSQIFALIPGGHMEHLYRTAALSISLGMGCNLQYTVSLLLSFRLQFLQLHSSISYQKNYLKCSLQFLAGDMQQSPMRHGSVNTA